MARNWSSASILSRLRPYWAILPCFPARDSCLVLFVRTPHFVQEAWHLVSNNPWKLMEALRDAGLTGVDTKAVSECGEPKGATPFCWPTCATHPPTICKGLIGLTRAAATYQARDVSQALLSVFYWPERAGSMRMVILAQGHMAIKWPRKSTIGHYDISHYFKSNNLDFLKMFPKFAITS